MVIILEPLGVTSGKFVHKSRNQNIFEKFKLNRNLQTIPFKMVYNMSMLHHRFSNEWWRGLNHLPLLFCESVYIDVRDVINFQVHLLFLAAGLLEDKAHEKGPVNVYIFQQLIVLSETK